MSRRSRSAVAVAAVSLLAAACASSGPGKGVQISAQSPGPQGAKATTTGKATTTNPFPGAPTWPFSGQPLADAGAAAHPAVVVKIDNSPEARPHTGVNQADIVFELRVEGITRFAALFHSDQPDPVGPVRSARSSDIDLLGNLGQPVMAWSGGNGGVVGQVHDARDRGVLVDGGADAATGFYYRDSSRKAPHNLYLHLPALLAERGTNGATPAPPFVFNAFGVPLPGSATDAPGLVVDFGGGVRVEYVWDAERSGWDRYQVDQLHHRGNSAFLDSAGQQVAPQNVVVLFCEYGQSEVDARSPQAYTIGSGRAMVLTQGKLVEGTWSRGSAAEPYTLTDGTGAPIMLSPGRTWVALPDQSGSSATVLDQGAADALTAERR